MEFSKCFSPPAEPGVYLNEISFVLFMGQYLLQIFHGVNKFSLIPCGWPPVGFRFGQYKQGISLGSVQNRRVWPGFRERCPQKVASFWGFFEDEALLLCINQRLKRGGYD